MVIQEAERRADREGVQPERDLGQLDRHGVLVDAVDAALEDHAPDDVAVVEPVPVDGPVALLRVRQDPVADGLDAADERRDIALCQRFRLGHGRDHSVGEIVDQTDQEVPGPHGRVADLQLKNLLGRVERCEPRNRPLALRSVCRHSPGFRLEGVRARLHERPDRFLDDQPDQVVRRVVAARTLAGEDVGADGHPVAVGREFVFQQTLVDRAELADAEIAIVDVAAARRTLLER